MNPESLLVALVDLAEAAGLRVRAIRPGAGADADFPALSGVCRLRGELWVLLAASEPVEAQTDVIACVLREHCREFLDGRYLSPAIRARIELSEQRDSISAGAPSHCPRG